MKKMFSLDRFAHNFIFSAHTSLPYADISGAFIASPILEGRILELYRNPCRLKAGIFVVCLNGQLDTTINLSRYQIHKNDFIALAPGSIIQYHSQTEDLRICFIAFSSGIMGDVNLLNSTMDFFPIMQENPVIPLPETTAEWMRDYFSLLSRSQLLRIEGLNTEIVRCILHSVLYGVGFLYRQHKWDDHVLNRSEEIYKQLLQTIRKHYARERGVAFYANKLNISPQHLSKTIKQITGKTVSEVIADLVIINAKALLKSTNLSIQEIAYSLNFPDISFFGKYFKRYVGTSPQKYRNQDIPPSSFPTVSE